LGYFPKLGNWKRLLLLAPIVMLSFLTSPNAKAQTFTASLTDDGCIEMKLTVCQKQNWCFTHWGQLLGDYIENDYHPSNIYCSTGGRYWLQLAHKLNGATGWTRFLDPSDQLLDGGIYEYYLQRYYGTSSITYEYEANDINAVIKWTDVSTVGSHELKLKSWFNGIPGCGFGVGFDKSATVTIPQLGDPTGFAATNGTECDKVKLTWNNPSCPSGLIRTIYYDILRDGIVILAMGTGSTSYDDIGADATGTAHTYSIRSYWVNGGGKYFYSNTINTSGKRKIPPVAPTVTNVSLNKCDLIQVQWNWKGENPDNFEIRAYNSVGTHIFTSSQISGTDRNCSINKTDDPDFAFFDTYNIKMQSQNECGSTEDLATFSWATAPATAGIIWGPPIAPTNVVSVYNSVSKNIDVTWTDADKADGYIVRRTLADGTSPTEYTVSTGVQTYTDESTAMCVTYKYNVLSQNYCKTDGVLGGFGTARKDPDLSNTFLPNSLSTSKGYYTDRVELSWTANNINSIKQYEITRTNPTIGESAVVATLAPPANRFIDNTTDAGILYNYKIQGKGDCEGAQIISNTVEEIGFRMPAGLVSGQITYSGGTATKNAKVFVNRTGATPGSSLAFNGGQWVVIPHNDIFKAELFTIELYFNVKPSATYNILISKKATEEFEIYTTPAYALEFVPTTGVRLVTPNNVFIPNEWTQVTCIYDPANNDARLFVNGQPIALTLFGSPTTTATLKSEEPIILGTHNGGGYFLNGNLDELRIYNRAKTNAEVAQDWCRYVNPSDNGLLLYLRMDENYGSKLYDLSKTGTLFNQNNASIAGAIWSISIPSTNQLAYIGYTDATGSYTINSIMYNGIGEIFKVTPVLGTHEFSPISKMLFIGEGSSIHSEINFLDKSSFVFKGRVNYDLLGVASNCPVEDAYVYLDGQMVFSSVDNLPIVSDATGYFEISVPIGDHYIEVKKVEHTFSVGRYPATGYHNFQQDFTSETKFRDNSRYLLIGKVAGGPEQNALPIGFGKGKNNIGRANILLEPTSNAANCGCGADVILTDATTGEFTASILPVKYNVKSVLVMSNELADYFPGPFDPIDMSKALVNRYEVDTVWIDPITKKNVLRVDSLAYRAKQTFIYYAVPQIDVTMDDGSPIKGEETFKYVTSSATTEIALFDGSGNPYLPYPVFTQGKKYPLRIKVFELYTNNDNVANPIENRVFSPSGTLNIVSNLSYPTTTKIELKSGKQIINEKEVYCLTGDTTYTLLPVIPNFDISDDKSFTNTIEINAQIGIHNVTWTPNAQLFRAYVFGGKPTGSDFFTQGPEVVDMILRDPPGSSSFATIANGTTLESSTHWDNIMDLGANIDGTLGIGMKLATIQGTSGPGVMAGTINEAETKVDIVAGIETKLTTTWSGDVIESKTFSKTISTSAEPNYVGAEADLFIGNSKNIIFGEMRTIKLIPHELCGVAAMCYDGITVNKDGQDFKLGNMLGMRMDFAPDATQFIYTRKHIKEALIPNIEYLRNNYLSTHLKTATNPAGIYEWGTVVTNTTHEYFGLNNYDIAFGAAASSKETGQFEGPSYNYNPPIDYKGIDTVQFLNQQIRLWCEALGLDEFEKCNVTTTDLLGGISFDAGSSYTYDTENSRGETSSWEIDFMMSTYAGAAAGGDFSIFGVKNQFKLEAKATAGYGHNHSESNTTTQTTAFSYTLADADEGDYYSVNVYESPRHFGPIFKVEAGRSSCPYSDIYITSDASFYYAKLKIENPLVYTADPASFDNKIINVATVQRERPSLRIEPSALFNVPSSQQAVFTVYLGNNSDSKEDMTYKLWIDGNSNPDGAIIEVDGFVVNNEITVPYGQVVQKILTVRTGPTAHEYNDITVHFTSPCQADIDVSKQFTVHFLPDCTPIEFHVPENKWILNTFANDTLNIRLKNYNYNDVALDKVQIQYKPTSNSQWMGVESFYKIVTIDGTAAIPSNKATIDYSWDWHSYPDGYYDLKAVVYCNNGAIAETQILTGITDRICPHNFGQPSPADGILSPNDEISIQYNEPINEGEVGWYNFDVRAVVNGSPIRHDAAVAFDGINNYVEIPEGVSLTNNSFSIEFWAKRSGLGEQCIFSQGNDAGNAVYIGYTVDNKLIFRINDQSIIYDTPEAVDKWVYWACVYDFTTQEAKIYRFTDATSAYKTQSMVTNYNTQGKITIGKCPYMTVNLFNGAMHELRIWNILRTEPDIASTAAVKLSGRETGLIGCWQMNEVRGVLCRDVARNRNAKMLAQWTVLPAGKAVELDGIANYVALNNTAAIFAPDQDFTIEYWFKSGNGNNICMLSNGKGDATDANKTSWFIGTNATGQIIVKSNTATFTATNTNYFDNNWHHFALVMNHLGVTAAYIDGDLQNSCLSSQWNGFGGSNLWLGTRAWFIDAVFNNDMFYSGQIDEVRIWNSARMQTQINEYMSHRLSGTESALVGYYPFERYEKDIFDNMVLIPSLVDVSSPTHSATFINGTDYTDITPLIKLERPVESIPVFFSTNRDKIIINPNVNSPGIIENCILDITVKNVKDLNGNSMKSPVTWTAYMDKNQVIWEEQELHFTKEINVPFVFKTKIWNIGGKNEPYTINNLPLWLTASPANSTISPNSYIEVTFTVNLAINSGIYSQDIVLSSSNGYNEKLPIELKVFATLPKSWAVDASKYQYSMSIFGQLKIEGIIANDPDDRVGVFVNGECRGIAQLAYIEEYDKYEALLTIYGNIESGESFDIHVWDASEAKEYPLVKCSGLPNAVAPYSNRFVFTPNEIYGSPDTPMLIETQSVLQQLILLNKGWNWVSFNLNFDNTQPLTMQLKSMKPIGSELIKTETQYVQFSPSIGWNGTLNSLNNSDMFMIKMNQKDTLIVIGQAVETEITPLIIHENWNRISYLPQENMQVKEAFASFTPNHGAVLKNQYSFAMYDRYMGWLGSLTYMRPNEGYMLYYKPTGTLPLIQNLVYPEKGSLSKGLLMNNEEWGTVYRANALNMTILAEVQNMNIATDDILGVFAENDCVGYGKPVSMPDGRKFFFIVANTDQNMSQLTFKLASGASSTLQGGGQITFNETTAFAANEMTGTLENPFILNANSEVTSGVSQQFNNATMQQCNVFPNPFASKTNFEINIENQEDILIEIFDVTGRRVDAIQRSNVANGKHIVEWEGSRFANGVYTARISVGSEQFIVKLVKTE